MTDERLTPVSTKPEVRVAANDDEVYAAKTRLKHLLDASTELLDALDLEHMRDPGDADAENLVGIRLGTAVERLRETMAYIKKAT